MSGSTDPISLSVDPTSRDDLVTGDVALSAGGEPLTLRLTIPGGEAATEELLPVLHGLCSLFATRGATQAERSGKTVSCRAGCGACCRQAVPIAAAEARRIAALVAAMPEPRRSVVRARFDTAVAALADAGLLARFDDPATIDTHRDGLAYFALGIACPFLEQESCSIHPDRPLACREYLVTSPADHCASPDPDGIATVPLEWYVSRSLMAAEPAGRTILTLALRDAGPPPAGRPGPDILATVLGVGRD